MFTGIVEGQAVVEQLQPRGDAHRLTLDLGPLAQGLSIGDSLAIDGACLSVVRVQGTRGEFDVIRETIERTSLVALRVRDRVNVERALRVDGRIHGHLVAGHVDGCGRVALRREEPGQTVLSVEVAPRLTAFMVEKGSIAVDGVSLTLTEVEDDRFSVALIPHTLAVTTLGAKGVGSLVNVEVDQIAKLVHRLVTAYVPAPPSAEEPSGIVAPGAALGLTLEHLRRAGFVK